VESVSLLAPSAPSHPRSSPQLRRLRALAQPTPVEVHRPLTTTSTSPSRCQRRELMPKHSEKDEAVLSAIPVVSTDRSEHDSSRKSRRGLNRSVLEAGQSASDAINAARAQTRGGPECEEKRPKFGREVVTTLTTS
jgi:hypothetical protein